MWDKAALPSPQEILSARREIKALEFGLRDAVEALEEAQLRVENLAKKLQERSAWVPPDETALSLPQEILSAQKEIKALEFEPRDVVEALERAQLRVENLTKKLEERRAWVAPIRQLPAELLSEIFILNSKDEHLGPVMITSVCRIWRSIVLATPRAWCDIWLYNNLSHENGYHYVSTFIERSNPLLLHLNIPLHYDLEDDEQFSICSILFRNTHRIRCLSMTSEHLAYVRGRTFPNLTDLSLQYGGVTFLLPGTFNSTFPRLQSLEATEVLWGKSPELSSGRIPLKRLTILADSVDAWLGIILYYSATLESLSVWGPSRRCRAPSEITLDFPVLKFLEFIELDYGINWPTRVRTPALVSCRESNRSSAGRLHGDVTTVTHLQTEMVPALLEYSSLRILGLKSSLAPALALLELLEENANICPRLEVIDLVLTRLSRRVNSYSSAQAKIVKAKQKIKRDIQLIIGESWGVLMAFDIKLGRVSVDQIL